jgi:dihydroorotate dehydrogenase electron transfer subunit
MRGVPRYPGENMETAWTLERAGRLRAATITRAVHDTPFDATIEFKDEAPMAPGQFFMVWVYGAEEVPMSASLIGPKGKRAVTARNFGETTAAIRELKFGDRVGLRGPFGNGFSMAWKKPLFVGGGVGMSSIITAIDAWAAKGRKPVVVVGGRTAKDLLYEARLRRLGAQVHLTTDDGSRGFHGTAVARAGEIMDASPFSQVVACGPERMLVALLAAAKKRSVKSEVAVERLMKCAMGICDVCTMDGLRVCRQGPIFDGAFLASSAQFGKVELNACGHLEPI